MPCYSEFPAQPIHRAEFCDVLHYSGWRTNASEIGIVSSSHRPEPPSGGATTQNLPVEPAPAPGRLASENGESHRLGDERGRPISFTFDDRSIHAYEGETVAVALMASGYRVLRTTTRRGDPRGLFCNMGVCHECLLEIDGQPGQRACRQLAAEGMVVHSCVGGNPDQAQS